MVGWNKLYFHEGFYKPNPNKSGQWNRGAYLVEGLGHCGTCHTATNLLGGTKTDEKFRDGDFGEHWYAPSLTGDIKEGIGAGSAADIVAYLKTGSNSKSSAAGPMAEVVHNSTQHLTDGDLYAIAAYLKDVPGQKDQAGGKTSRTDSQAQSRGEAVFFDNCTGCHMESGAGIAQVFPDLKGNAVVQSGNRDTVIHVVVAGAKTPGTSGKPTRFSMPAFDRKLSDQEIADVVNFIRNAWDIRASTTSASAVSKVRKEVEHGGG